MFLVLEIIIRLHKILFEHSKLCIPRIYSNRRCNLNQFKQVHLRCLNGGEVNSGRVNLKMQGAGRRLLKDANKI